ncbi:PIR protein, putative [Plasmodium sp.]|nr:PIR protein, putative [Plasmodium sp.]
MILGTISLIYNNCYKQLYKNINYNNIVLVPKNFRSLAELLYEPTIYHIHENNELGGYGNTNGTKYKNKYPKNYVKPNQNIPEATEKENTQTTNLKKYRKGECHREKETKSNKSSCSLKHLEIQRKLYNNFYVKPERYCENFSDKSNDIFCECSNNKKTYNVLNSSNKVHDNYLDNLKKGCFRGVRACMFPSVYTGVADNLAPTFAGAAAAAKSILGTTSGISFTQLMNAFAALGSLTESVIKKFITSSSITGVNISLISKAAGASEAATTAAATASTSFYLSAIAGLVLILIVVVLIILYILLRKRTKNSWKHEYQKHLCT